MADVFISYSRKDIDFAKRIVKAIYDRGCEDIWVDWEDIEYAEDWWKKIQSGIESADNFIFILTPNSVQSEICYKEVETAFKSGKRIIPVLHIPITEKSDSEKMHPVISSQNWLPFQAKDVFDEGMRQLITTIETDLKHVKLHTRYYVRALDWQRVNQNPSFLLTGDEIDSAEEWLASASEKDPLPTDLHGRFIRASRERDLSEQRRIRNLRLTSIVAGLIGTVAIIATIFATLSSVNANNQSATATIALGQSIFEARTATNAQGQALIDADNANTQQAIALNNVDSANTQQAQALLDANNANTQQAEAVLAQQTSNAREAEANQRLDEVENTIVPATLDAVATQVQAAEDEFQSLELAARSLGISNAGDPVLGITLALEASYIDAPPQTELILSELAYQPGERARFTGHTDIVRTVVFSPDGSQILSSGDDGIIILRDATSGIELQRFEGHRDPVWSVAFSPDGTQIVSGSLDSTIALWDVASGRELWINGDSLPIWTVAFSPDGSQVISGSMDDTIALWDVESGLGSGHFEGHSDNIHSVVFSPDGSQILSGSDDGTAILWDVASLEIVRRFESNNSVIRGVAFSPDGSQILTGSDDGAVILWDVTNGIPIHQLEGHDSAITSVAFSPDGAQIISGSADYSLLLWDVVSGKSVHRFIGHRSIVRTVAFSPDSSQVISGDDNFIIRWQVTNGSIIRRYQGHEDIITSVAFSPDGLQSLSSSADNSIILWDMVNGGHLKQLQGHEDTIESAVFSPDGSQIVSDSVDSNIILWNVESGQEVQRFDGHRTSVNSIAVSPDGSTFVSGSSPLPVSGVPELILWDMESGEEIRRFEGFRVQVGNQFSRYRGHTDSIYSLAFSPDGSQIISGSADNSIILWDVETGRIIHELNRHMESVMSVAFSPDGSQIISGSADNSIILWDVESGEELQHFEGHADSVWTVAFSPDGSHIISGSADNSIILWDVTNGSELRRFEGHADFVWSVAFSPDGTQILSGSWDNSLILWRYDTLEQLQSWIKDNWVLSKIDCGERRAYDLENCTVINGRIDFNERRYNYSGEGIVNIYVESDDFDPQLYIFDSDRNTLAENDDFNGLNSGIEAFILPENGDIIIQVSDWNYGESGGGNFVLSIEPVELETINIGAIESRIEIGRYHHYSYSGNEAIHIYLESDDFDTYLTIYDSNGHTLAENDDLQGLNSGIINFNLPEDGEIIIKVGTYWIDQGGEYTLTIEPGTNAPRVNEPTTIPQIDTGVIEDEINIGGHQFYHYSGDSPINIYLSSNEFDTYLYAYAGNGELLAENDDYNGTNSVIENLMPPADGDIIIEVRSFADQEGGMYTLTVEQVEIIATQDN